MIRLTNILETKKQDKKLLRVLYISDHGQDKKIGFMKRLLQQRKVIGLIRTAHEKSSTELLTVFEHYISRVWDLVIISCRGIFEPNKYQDAFNIIQNYRVMKKSAHDFNVPILFVNTPTARFINTANSNIDLTKGDDTRIDDWIAQNADYVLNTNDFLEPQYFDRTGKRFSRLAESILYKEMLDIIRIVELSKNDMESEKETDTDKDDIKDNPVLMKGIRGKKIREIQKKLIDLGYKIDTYELQQSQVGATTIAAFIEFKTDNDLDDNNILDRNTLNALKTSIPTKAPETLQQFPSWVVLPSAADMKIYKAILRGIGAPITANTLTFLFAWRDLEAGTASFNPFNTTQPYNDATKYNIVGVRNYKSAEDGIFATIKTLKNGSYDNLLRSLRNDDPPEVIASNIDDLTTWGSKDGPLKVLQTRHVNPEPINHTFEEIEENIIESLQRKQRILKWIKENKNIFI